MEMSLMLGRKVKFVLNQVAHTTEGYPRFYAV